MSATPSAGSRAEEEAAVWFARLNALSIPAQALEEFQAWRRDPANDAAYERIEAIWATAGRLTRHPDTVQGVRAALARSRRRRRLAPLWSLKARIGYGLAMLAGAAALAVALVIGAGQAYETGIGEQRLVSLDDGSRLRLDTRTQVRVRYSPRGRDVELVHGQAFFDVAPDPARPFVVRAADVSVRALGTRFDVRRQDRAVRVTLVEGSVEVADQEAGRAWRLSPGQALGADEGGPRTARPVDVAVATSWTTGRLIFRDTPLAEAVAEMNRYSARRVVLDAPALQDLPMNGVFEAGDTSAFVSAVSGLFQLRTTQSADEIRLSPKA